MKGSETFATVGASLAGAKAAETLRGEGFDGRVVLLGAERTWDCACHGSRFAPEGAVIQGPAKKPLEPKEPAGDRA